MTFVGDVRQIVDSIAGRGHTFPMFEQGAQTDLLMLAREGLPVDEGFFRLDVSASAPVTSG